jgi:hypothetical protein
MFYSLLILVSCDPGSEIKYQVMNKTKKTLNLKYLFWDDSTQTLMTIGADSNRIIKTDMQLGYVNGIDERRDSIYLSKFEVKAGGRISLKNFKDKKYWKFKKDDDLHASYILTIDDSFFN